MKKIWNFIKKTPLNPIVFIVIFTIIGIVLLFKDDKNAIEYFFTSIGTGISFALIQCTLIQNQTQKDNIKIQLFDKRYAVFQAVVDTITIIKRNNWDRYLLFCKNDISKQMISIEENLYKSIQLSACLFNEDMYLKLVEVNNAFCRVAESYKNMLVSNLKELDTQSKKEDCLSFVNSNIFSQEGLNSKEYEEELKEKFPNIYRNLMDFSEKCDIYMSFVARTRVIKDFENYITLDKLDE